MDIDQFLSSLNPEPVVQKKKKYSTFTVREIGGPDEIGKWREMQAAKEATYRLKLKSRDERLAAFQAETGQLLAKPTIHTTSWAEKQAFAKSERIRLAKLEDVAERTFEPTPEIKKTLFQKISGFFSRVWKSANF